MFRRMNSQSQSTTKRNTAIRTTVVNTSAGGPIEFFLARPRDLVHLRLGGDEELGERAEVDDPEDDPSQDEARSTAGMPSLAERLILS